VLAIAIYIPNANNPLFEVLKHQKNSSKAM
jgi:hypothetical protein